MEIITLILPVFAVVAVGYGAVRFKVVPETIAPPLVQFVYHICIPALMFHIIASDPLHSLLNWDFWIAFGGGSLLLLALVYAVGWRWLGDDLGHRTVLAFTAVLTNTAFVALPVLHVIFGAKGVPPAAIANIIIAAVFFSLLLVLLEVARRDNADDKRATIRKLVRGVVLSPMVWPTVLGFLFSSFSIPVPATVTSFLVILGSALTPCALFAIGATIDLQHIRHDARRIAVLSVTKLIGLPALVFAIAYALEMAPFFIIAATICASVPTGKSIYFLASEYKVAEKSTSAMISATTLGAIVTMTGWLLILGLLYPEVFKGTM